MKKLSLLIALCMLLSIGGVYATWSYASGTIDNKHHHLTMSVTGAETTEAEGQFVLLLNDLQLIIDDLPGAEGVKDFRGDALFTGAMHYVFKPGFGADPEVKNGVDVQVQVKHENPLMYTPLNSTQAEDLFTIDATPITIEETSLILIDDDNYDDLIPGVDLYDHRGTYYFKIDGEMVKNLISVNLYLPTLDDYDHFRKWFDDAAKGKILGIEVSKKSD